MYAAAKLSLERCTAESPEIVLQLHTCSPKVIGTHVKQGNSSSSSVSLDIVYREHQQHNSEALQRHNSHKQNAHFLGA